MADRLICELNDVADEINVAKNFIACVFAAAEGGPQDDERSAICAVANAAREKLEAAMAMIDRIQSTGGFR